MTHVCMHKLPSFQTLAQRSLEEVFSSLLQPKAGQLKNPWSSHDPICTIWLRGVVFASVLVLLRLHSFRKTREVGYGELFLLPFEISSADRRIPCVTLHLLFDLQLPDANRTEQLTLLAHWQMHRCLISSTVAVTRNRSPTGCRWRRCCNIWLSLLFVTFCFSVPFLLQALIFGWPKCCFLIQCNLVCWDELLARKGKPCALCTSESFFTIALFPSSSFFEKKTGMQLAVFTDQKILMRDAFVTDFFAPNWTDLQNGTIHGNLRRPSLHKNRQQTLCYHFLKYDWTEQKSFALGIWKTGFIYQNS